MSFEGNTYTWDASTNTKTILVTSSGWADVINCNSGGVGPTLTSAHTCHIICNDADHKMDSLECGSVGTCHFTANANHCFKEATINAQQAQNLIWEADYKSSEKSTIHLPYQGTATITSTAAGDGVLKTTTIIGHETTSIDITITSNGANKDECKGFSVDASDSEFLSLTLSTGVTWKDNDETATYSAFVKCPESSTVSPSCVINTVGATSITGVDFYALNGTPQDLQYTGDSATDSTNWLYCLDLDAKNSRSGITTATHTFDSGTCFITADPTKFPTQSPSTSDPTSSPSKYPTISPTKYPSRYPSMSPSKFPTGSPSKFPTLSPTTPPTMIPTDVTMYPSLTPTSANPTMSPTFSPIVGQVGHVSEPTFMNTYGTGMGNAVIESGGVDTIGAIAIILSLLVCCLCGFGIFGLWKYQSLRAQKDSEIIRMQSNVKNHGMNGFLSMKSLSMDDYDGGDGDRTTTTSPWMIPGQRETGMSTIQMYGMEGGANSSGLVEEAPVLQEGAHNTGDMDLFEEESQHNIDEDYENAILTPNGAMESDDDDDIVQAIGNIATPMGPAMGNDNDIDAVANINGDIDGDIIRDINDQIPEVIVDDNVTTQGQFDNDDEGSVSDVEDEGDTFGDDDDDILIENDINDNMIVTMGGDIDDVMLDNEESVSEYMKEKREKQNEEFGQMLGDVVMGQDMVLDDIVNEMDTEPDEDDADEDLLTGIDTVQ